MWNELLKRMNVIAAIRETLMIIAAGLIGLVLDGWAMLSEVFQGE